ncbi:hypothetical protein CRYUN_Cryun33cG0008700 [Craigia yunnanensis]
MSIPSLITHLFPSHFLSSLLFCLSFSMDMVIMGYPLSRVIYVTLHLSLKSIIETDCEVDLLLPWITRSKKACCTRFVKQDLLRSLVHKVLHASLKISLYLDQISTVLRKQNRNLGKKLNRSSLKRRKIRSSSHLQGESTH